MTAVPAVPGPEAAAPSTAPPHRHRRRRHHLHGGARCGPSTTHLVPTPLKARTPGPRIAPDRTRSTPGSTSSIPAPLRTQMSANIQHMPRYRRHRESQPNAEAETVRAYP